jgi:hypothetical protein
MGLNFQYRRAGETRLKVVLALIQTPTQTENRE